VKLFGRRPDHSPSAACPSCGRSLDAHNQHVRFLLPEPVLAIPVEERVARTWQTDVMMQVAGAGAFVRALLPVRLDGGHRLTFGLWLGVPPEDLHRALEQWWAPSYSELVLDGVIANRVFPWDVLGKPARAVVRDPDETPYLDTSTDHEVTHVLHDTWPHDYVMNALPESLRGTT
jgi:hypothetical protein